MADTRDKDITTIANSVAPDDWSRKDGATKGTRRISPLDEHGQFTNALAPAAALVCDGTAITNRIVWPLGANAALGNGSSPRGFALKWGLPAAAPGSTTVFWTWGDAASPTAHFVELAHTSGDALRLRIYGATTSDYLESTVAGLVSNYGANRTVIVMLAMSTAGGLLCWINGVAVTVTTGTPGGSAPADWQAALTSTVAAWHGGLAIKFYSWFPMSFAPTATNALNSFFLGGEVPKDIPLGVGGLWYTSDFSAGADNWSTGYSHVLTGNVTAGPGGDQRTACLQFYMSGDCAFAYRQLGGVSVPIRLMCGVDYYIPSANVSETNFLLGRKNGTFNPDRILAPGVKGAWASFIADYTISSNGTYEGVGVTGSPYYGAGNESIYFRNFALWQPCALFFAAPQASGDGCGYQLHDISAAGVDGILPAGGWTWTHPTQQGYIRGQTATNGVQQIAGATLLPANCQITKIRAKSSSTPTVTIGTSSGTHTELVASITLSTAWQNLTIALGSGAGINAAANSIYVGSGTTATVYTHLNYELLS